MFAHQIRDSSRKIGFANQGFDLTSLGLPQSLVSQLPGGYLMGVWSVGGYQTLGRTSSDNITNSYGLQGSINKVFRGKHSIKAGVDVRRIYYEVLDTAAFWRRISVPPGTSRSITTPVTVWAATDMPVSCWVIPAAAQSNYAAYPYYRQWYISPFIQDDWHVSNRLTLTLGLRYDINEPITEKYNRLDAAFNPTAPNPIGPMAIANIKSLNLQIPAQYQYLYNNLANMTGSMEFVGKNGYSPLAAKIDWTGIQPRFGFAYRLKDKLVMRGGFGQYIVNPNNDWMQTAGFSNNTSLVNSNDGGRTPIQGVMQNPFPSGINAPPAEPSSGPLTYAKSINWFNPKSLRLPRDSQYSFDSVPDQPRAAH